MTENSHILRHIVRAIKYLAMLGIALHCGVEKADSLNNPTNFLAILKSYAETERLL